MTITEIGPFDARSLPAAAELLARRHRRHRQAFPELPRRFEDEGVSLQALAAAWNRPGASGAAAYGAGGRLLGYLLGDRVENFHFGRAAWVRPAGHALAADADPELYRDLYAAAAARWLEQGCFRHVVQVPADPQVLDGFFRLGFGQQQAHGVVALAGVSTRLGADPGDLVIRRAGPGDAEALAELSGLIARAHMEAPTWAPTPPEDFPELREGYAGLPGDETVLVWLVEDRERLLAFQVFFPVVSGDDDLLAPDRGIELKVAATVPEARGRGLGRALSERSFADARERGYACLLTDWRVTNLSSSRFFPRLGFRPAFYRLVRSVDPRIAWTARRP